MPYRLGGNDPRGFDCSGLVAYAFELHGVKLPRTVPTLFAFSQPVPRTSIAPGDLLFFATAGDGPSHVAMALDGTRFIHAPSSRGVVRIERLDQTYWAQRFLGARRVVAR